MYFIHKYPARLCYFTLLEISLRKQKQKKIERLYFLLIGNRHLSFLPKLGSELEAFLRRAVDVTRLT